MLKSYARQTVVCLTQYTATEVIWAGYRIDITWKSWSHPSTWKLLILLRTQWREGEDPVYSIVPQTSVWSHPIIVSPGSPFCIRSLKITQSYCIYLLPWGGTTDVFSLFVSLLFLRLFCFSWKHSHISFWSQLLNDVTGVGDFLQAWRVAVTSSPLPFWKVTKNGIIGLLLFLLTKGAPGQAAVIEERVCLYLEEVMGSLKKAVSFLVPQQRKTLTLPAYSDLCLCSYVQARYWCTILKTLVSLALFNQADWQRL